MSFRLNVRFITVAGSFILKKAFGNGKPPLAYHGYGRLKPPNWLPFWAVVRFRRVHEYIDSARFVAEACDRCIGTCDGQRGHSGLQLRK